MSDIDRVVARVNELSRAARNSWVTLLSFVAFIFVTLLSVEHADFFVASRQTELPLINVSIPTIDFFGFAPWVCAALYANLHFQLMRLWETLSPEKAPGFKNSRHFSDRITVSFIADMALAVRIDDALRPRPLYRWTAGITWMFVFLAPPLVLGAFWWRSMPARDLTLTLGWIGAPFLFSILVFLGSTLHFVRNIRGSDPLERFSAIGGSIILIAVVSMIGWMRTDGGNGWDRYLAYADLSDTDLVDLPSGWEAYDAASRNFQFTWCNEQKLPINLCVTKETTTTTHLLSQTSHRNWCSSNKPDLAMESCLDELFSTFSLAEDTWVRSRTSTLSKIARLNLEGGDFRGADLESSDLQRSRLADSDFARSKMDRARFEAADFSRADLSHLQAKGAQFQLTKFTHATLIDAVLDGADFSFASARQTNFRDADLSEVNLYAADLEAANFSGAILIASVLHRANLTSSDLRGANLFYAKVFGARFNGTLFDRKTDFTDATLDYSAVREVDFSGTNISQKQLNSMFGDRTVVLPAELVYPEHWLDEEADYNSDFLDAWRTWQRKVGYLPKY